MGNNQTKSNRGGSRPGSGRPPKDRSGIRNRIVDTRRIRAGDLIPNPKNWRTHPKPQADAMRGILTEIGYTTPLMVVETPDGLMLIDGHLRAETTPDTLVPVSVVDLTPEEADEILVLHDPLGAMAGRAADKLAALVASVRTDNAALRALIEGLGGKPKDGLTEPNAVPEPPESATKPGDLWLLGEHRLLCGDSAVPANIRHLMQGAAASMLWTDPPYGVSYEGGTDERLTMQNDDAPGAIALLRAVCAAVAPVLASGAPFYVCHPSGPLGLDLGLAIRAAGWSIHETLVWVKDALVLGHSDYHYRHEPIYYGSTAEHQELAWYGDFVPAELERVRTSELILYGWQAGAAHPWLGGRSETTVFDVARPKASREHPTMKPTELVERMLANSSLPYSIVLDPFLGSGTTLIACERLGRRCYAMEIEPRYVDVAVRRWEEFTGRTAVLGV